jgi:site-specific DNA-cytosine methylase
VNRAFAAYRDFLESSGDYEQLFLGKEGNILNYDMEKLPCVNGLVAGPPCPPWSSIGKKDCTVQFAHTCVTTYKETVKQWCGVAPLFIV